MDNPVVEKVGELFHKTVSVAGTAVVNLAVGQIYNNIGNNEEDDVVEIEAVETDETQMPVFVNGDSIQNTITQVHNDSDMTGIEDMVDTYNTCQICDEIN